MQRTFWHPQTRCPNRRFSHGVIEMFVLFVGWYLAPFDAELVKLNPVPYICKADRYLAGWQAALLNPMGRTVLINTVLGGQLSYVMCAMPIPPGVIAQIDKRRRSFLWTGDDNASGSSCLVAWDNVCLPCDQGGLGIKDLATQNTCLLLKLLHKLYGSQLTSWARWVRRNVCLANLEGSIQGAHWDALKMLLPLYQAITTVTVGDGRSTSFWHDVWCGDESFSEKFGALMSHCKDDKLSVHDAVTGGLQASLAPRLTPLAASELNAVSGITSGLALTASSDTRHSPFADADGALQTSALYALLKSMQAPSAGPVTTFWKCSAPPRVQFFAWLLQRDRIQCKTNLLRRHVLVDDICDLCGQAPETASHLIFHCQFASMFWRSIGFQLPSEFATKELHCLPRPPGIPAAHFDTFTLLCCWQLWKRRNGIVFRNETLNLHQTLQICKTIAQTWTCRLPRDDRAVIDQWCNLFSLAM